MKVIKPGNPAKQWTTRVTCTGRGNGNRGCQAVLEITVDDLFTTHSNHYDGSTEHYITFRCCQCGSLTDVRSTCDPKLDVKGEFAGLSLPSKNEWYEKHGIALDKSG